MRNIILIWNNVKIDEAKGSVQAGTDAVKNVIPGRASSYEPGIQKL
jgi:hypothetical protein